MTAALLTQATVARLEALAGSPQAQAALAAREKANAVQRVGILDRLQADQTAAAAVCSAAVEAEAPRAVAVQALRQQLAAAEASLFEAPGFRLNVGAALERLHWRAVAALAPLGGAAIDAAASVVRHELRAWLAGTTYRVFGRGGVAPDRPTTRADELNGLLAELENLRLSPTPPAAIEQRCSTIEAEVLAAPGSPVQARATAGGVLARLLGR